MNEPTNHNPIANVWLNGALKRRLERLNQTQTKAAKASKSVFSKTKKRSPKGQKRHYWFGDVCLKCGTKRKRDKTGTKYVSIGGEVFSVSPKCEKTSDDRFDVACLSFPFVKVQKKFLGAKKKKSASR